MSVKIEKVWLETLDFNVLGLAFLPEHIAKKNVYAVFSHGYTASKSDCMNWAARLAEIGVPTLIFDLPGHYLGSFNEAESFEVFKQKAHTLFEIALNHLKHLTAGEISTVVLGGHSLGALLSLKAMELDLGVVDKVAIGVGFGLANIQGNHLFETDFYQKTLHIRRQLVSVELKPENVFGWIKEQKENITLANSRVHLITGADDVVVGVGGANRLKEILELNGNIVTLEEPTRLPHHEPALASPHVLAFVRTLLA